PGPSKAVTDQYAQTQSAARTLEIFLSARDMSKLPPRLLGPLNVAREQLGQIAELRRRAETGKLPLDDEMRGYGVATGSLISATAALSELSDDGELLRRITALVAVLELRERGSREHAVLDYVFAFGRFPPGSYRDLVTLLTEAATYEGVLKTSATSDQLA